MKCYNSKDITWDHFRPCQLLVISMKTGSEWPNLVTLKVGKNGSQKSPKFTIKKPDCPPLEAPKVTFWLSDSNKLPLKLKLRSSPPKFRALGAPGRPKNSLKTAHSVQKKIFFRLFQNFFPDSKNMANIDVIRWCLFSLLGEICLICAYLWLPANIGGSPSKRINAKMVNSLSWKIIIFINVQNWIKLFAHSTNCAKILIMY